MSWRIGVDIGGAFTDLIAVNDETGETRWVKVESTPKDYSEGVIETFVKSKLNLHARKIRCLVHGQTIVINTIITRSGSETGLITTEGFHILEIGRANRRDMFNLKYRKPEQFVSRYLTSWVKERIAADGSVVIPVDEDEMRNAARELIEKGCQSIAVSLINSYANPEHEKKAERIVKEEMETRGKSAYVTLSSELSSEWREYERTSTAVLNAYTQPRLDAYTSVLEQALKRMNFEGIFYVMLASGGMATSDFAKKYPITTVEGGPIAGIVGSVALAELLGYRDLIVLDGGSTTTKAGLVKDLVPRITTEYYVGRDRFRPGHPIKVPVVEITEVGNGGTSIAWIDDVGALKVGPKAAGAYPGPACYGKGGVEPTLTDAYIVTGYLNPNYLLGGELKIYRDKAEGALKRFADYYKIPIEDVAEAIIRIANDQAAYAIRLVSVQRGLDPRDFTLIAHGGSGPMFAPFIASELHIPRIVVPVIPVGVFNAWGMLVADVRHDLVRTHIMKLTGKTEDAKLIDDLYNALQKQLLDIFAAEKVELEKVFIMRHADMRYYGQEHVIKVPVMSGKIGAKEVKEIENAFINAHEKEYGFILEDNPVEIVNFHTTGILRVKKPTLQTLSHEGKTIGEALKEEREVYFGRTEGLKRTPIYSRDLLPTGVEIAGPAIIEETTSTTIVAKDFKAKTDKFGNVLITKK
jgi:N-methylhydantoinase A